MTMIRDLIRRTPWRALLIPAGAALLTAGTNFVRDQADEQESRLSELVELVELRRAQLSGDVPLDVEPAGEPTSSGDRSRSLRRPLALAGAGLVLGAAVAYAVRRLVAQLDDFPPADPWPWEQAAASTGAGPLLVDEPAPVEPVDQADEPAPEPAPEP